MRPTDRLAAYPGPSPRVGRILTPVGLTPRVAGLLPCVVCHETTTDVRMRTPGRPDVGEVACHGGCAAFLVALFEAADAIVDETMYGDGIDRGTASQLPDARPLYAAEARLLSSAPTGSDTPEGRSDPSIRSTEGDTTGERP